ncbi:uncharacterized protein LOC131623633 [Vicia villosa]|uniref:uncharacterized protein LOC131623633 n=1 Tax=Vicia villosa TaxID=3911 RepID=UPI00273C2DFB|nr:uncharacterized protein LOC131623633 [Vicia villosa]
MLLSHEARLERTPRAASQDPIALNVTQGTVTPSVNSTVSMVSDATSHDSAPQTEYSRGGRGGRASTYRGGGRNGGRNRVQCQICSKPGHDAKVCYYRLPVPSSNASQWRAPMVPVQASQWYQGAPAQHAPNQWIAPQFVQMRTPAAAVRPDKQPQVYVAGTGAVASQSASPWYADSGATHHVTNSAEHFLDSIPASGTDQVTLGNGQGYF